MTAWTTLTSTGEISNQFCRHMEKIEYAVKKTAGQIRRPLRAAETLSESQLTGWFALPTGRRITLRYVLSKPSSVIRMIERMESASGRPVKALT
jgi:hypothetical protein